MQKKKVEIYNVDWVKGNNDLIKYSRDNILMYSSALIIVTLISVYLYLNTVLSAIKTILSLILFYSIFGAFLIAYIRTLRFFKKYSFVKKIEIYDGKLVYYTPLGYRFGVKFEDIALINMAERVRSVGRYLKYFRVIILYYNKNLNRCVLMMIERSIGLKVIKHYKEYVESKGLKPCPIITGDLKSQAEVDVPIKKLEKSPFCKR